MHGFRRKPADLGEQRFDLPQARFIFRIADGTPLYPFHGRDAVALHQDTLQRDHGSQASLMLIALQRQGKRKRAAKGDVLLHIMRAGIPVHHIIVGTGLDLLQDLVLHAFGVQDHRLAPFLCQPQLTAKELIRLVRSAGDRAAYPDNIYGYGVPDMWKAYRSTIENDND